MSIGIRKKRNLDPDILNLLPHILEDFCRLRRRFNKRQTTSDRLWNIEEIFKKKSTEGKVNPLHNKIEIEICKEPISYLQKISLPNERYLTSLKRQSKFLKFSKERKRNVNKLLVEKRETTNNNRKVEYALAEPSYEGKEQSSSNSLKGDIKGNKIQSGHHKMAKINRRSFMTGYVPGLSDSSDYNIKTAKFQRKKPSEFLRARRIKKKEEAFKEFYKRLSTPRTIKMPSVTSSWKLTRSLQNFTPSDRLLEMAQPKRIVAPRHSFYDFFKVKKAALHYKATNRIVKLALPTSLPEKKPDPFQVPQRALSAKISERVAELAHPKNRSDRTIRKHPFKVSRKALYARATKHIKELAQPRP